MSRFWNIVGIGFVLIMAASCGGLRTGVGIRGIMCKDNLMTLDGDTFRIQERIGDSLLIVCPHTEDYESSYLIKQEGNGFYYVLQKGHQIYSIINTRDFIGLDDNVVYSHRSKESFTLPCDVSYLYYLGQWNGLHAFANQDTVCFSDGKCVTLQDDAWCEETDEDGNVILIMGARELAVSLKDLYQLKKTSAVPDHTVSRFNKEYFIKTYGDDDGYKLGFKVDLDIPKGDSDGDKAIRKWMISSIKDDAFSLLNCQRKVTVGKCGTAQEMMSILNQYGVLWDKLCRNNYEVDDTLRIEITCDVRTRKIVDCDDYVTYYWASIYDGGLHGMPRSYYVTYDKSRQILLNASNTIKPNMIKRFRKETLARLKRRYDKNNGGESDLDDFKQLVFSFYCPMFGSSGLDNVMRSMLQHKYECDEWSGWGIPDNKTFTMDNFPLPHLAVLPEGIALSYHPYQIDCFGSGEYLIVVPYDKVGQCLQYRYRHNPDDMPCVNDFIK